MSQISRELEVLFFLSKEQNRNRYVSTTEIAEHLKISTRQARRYIDDLVSILELDLDIKYGRNGGYKLKDSIPNTPIVSNNVSLALSISMKKNKKIEEVVSLVQNFVFVDEVSSNNSLEDETVEKLYLIIEALKNNQIVQFKYKDYDKRYLTVPYKIVLTNHTYYLYCIHERKVKTFRISDLNSINLTGEFTPNEDNIRRINERIKKQENKEGEEITLRVKCVDDETLMLFDNYFEGKGIIDYDTQIFTVVSNNENELYYPLVKINTKKYTFLDNAFKANYIKFLINQIDSVENQR